MFKGAVSCIFLLIGVLVLVGCAREDRIQNFRNQGVGSHMTKEKVRSCIISAGQDRGWSMREVKPGHIIGRLNVRKHVANVDVDYNDRDYSITYRSSENLMKNGDTIHRNYNKWVRLLNKNIRQCVYD